MCSKGSYLIDSEDGDILEVTLTSIFLYVKTFPPPKNSLVCLLAHGCIWHRHAKVSTTASDGRLSRKVQQKGHFGGGFWTYLKLMVAMKFFFRPSQALQYICARV